MGRKEKTEGTETGLAEMKVFSGDSNVPKSDHSAVETMNCKEMGIPPEISCQEKEKRTSERGSCSSSNLPGGLDFCFQRNREDIDSEGSALGREECGVE